MKRSSRPPLAQTLRLIAGTAVKWLLIVAFVLALLAVSYASVWAAGMTWAG